MATLVAIGATVTLVIGAAPDEPFPHRPAIHFAAGVPDDLRDLASATWDRFLDAFPARWGCLPDVTLRGAWHARTRAAYDPARRRVTVRIPGTAPNLRATMIHEFAHHVEFTCAEQRRIRAPFIVAQEFPPGTPWRRGDTWAQIPSEQYAEATIQVVLGPQPNARVLVSRAALQIIRGWGRGR
jgi:hypothetical protein